MIVIDASAALLALLNDGAARRRLIRDPLAAPHLVDVELAHALRAQVRRGRITGEAGAFLLERWARLGVRRYPLVGLLARIWDLRHNLSAYDASYVALAEAIEWPLLTGDARLAAAPGLACEITVVRG